jgi:thiamine-monophosphate kinase
MMPGVAQDALLSGGDDYELCFTASPRQHTAVLRVAARARVPVTRIGRIVKAPAGAVGVAVMDRDGLPLRVTQRGFDHFG